MAKKEISGLIKDVLKELASDKQVKDQIQEKVKIETLFSGSPILDIYLGGGIPKSRLLYLWGGESTGKSTLSAQIMSSFYKQYGDDAVYVWIDTEESFDKRRFEQLNVNTNTDNFIVTEPTTINDVRKFLKTLYAKLLKKFPNGETPNIFIVWDSVSSTTVDEEFYDETNKISPMARAIATFFRNVKLKSWNMTMIAISQYRETNINKPYAAKEPPGGRAIRHKAHITLYLTSKKTKVISPEAGREVQIYTQKSKQISPFRKIPFVYFFTTGYDSVITSIFLLQLLGVIKKKNKYIVPWSEDKYTIDELYEYALKGENSYDNFWLPIFNWIINLFPDEKDYILDILPKIKEYYFDDKGVPILDRWTTFSTTKMGGISGLLGGNPEEVNNKTVEDLDPDLIEEDIIEEEEDLEVGEEY